MLTEERIKLFKNVSGNYSRYKDQIKEIDEKINYIQNRMENVHSVEFDKVVKGADTFPKNSLVDLIEQKTRHEKERQYYSDLIQWVEDLVDSCHSGAVKALIWMSCVQKRSLSSIAAEYDMNTDSLYKIRRKHLDEILDDAAIKKYEQIQSTASESVRTVSHIDG